jgi:hypothetical protein
MLGYVKLPATQYNINTSETLNLAQKLGFVWLYFPVCVFSLLLIMYYISFIFFKENFKMTNYIESFVAECHRLTNPAAALSCWT